MKYFLQSWVAAVILLSCAGGARGQNPFEGPSSGIDSSLVRLLGEVGGFSSKAELRILDAEGKLEKMSALIDFAAKDGKIRQDMDMAMVKSSQIPPESVGQMKMLGLDQSVNIIRPDKSLAYVLFPSLQVYLEIPLPKSDAPSGPGADKAGQGGKAAGNETIDGHPCVREDLTITDQAGNAVAASRWKATDLKDFPIKLQVNDHQTTLIVLFKKVNRTSPGDSRFEPPSGFAKCAGQQELMQAAMKKMQDGGGFPAPPAPPAPTIPPGK